MLATRDNIINYDPINSTLSATGMSSNVSLKKIYNSILVKLVLPITAFSISWFITDEIGNIHKNGVAQIENLEIDVSTLPKGTYTIRLMGEVHSFERS